MLITTVGLGIVALLLIIFINYAFDVFESRKLVESAAMKPTDSSSLLPEKSTTGLTPRAKAPGEWVVIRAGSFMMGPLKNDPGRPCVAILHRVTLTNDFELQTTEVTQGQFEKVMGYNPSRYKYCGQKCPVERVTWHEAAMYCNRLSDQENLEKCYLCSGAGRGVRCLPNGSHSSPYTCPGYRLPTEAEWEYAARSGTTGYRYGHLNDIAWFRGNSLQAREVGTKKASRWGLHDMIGSNWEWCHDWYGDYPVGAGIDPIGPSTGLHRVVRGGSWGDRYGWGYDASYRYSVVPNNRRNTLGFRPSRSRH